MEKYEVISTLNEGRFGQLLKCQNRITKEFVTLKKGPKAKWATDYSVSNELQIFKALQKHPNIVIFHESVVQNGESCLVLEFLHQSLDELFEHNLNGFHPRRIHQYVSQLLQAVNHCHSHNVVHRDIQPQSIMFSKNIQTNDIGALKLSDFSSARLINPNERGQLTNQVGSLWYKAPELLLGSVKYSFSVDMWSVGCVLGEMIDGMVVFEGHNPVEQYCLIQDAVGRLDCRGRSLIRRGKVNTRKASVDFTVPSLFIERYASRVDKTTLSLLSNLLSLEPGNRLTATEALTYLGHNSVMDTEHAVITAETENVREGATCATQQGSAELHANSKEAHSVAVVTSLTSPINISLYDHLFAKSNDDEVDEEDEDHNDDYSDDYTDSDTEFNADLSLSHHSIHSDHFPDYGESVPWEMLPPNCVHQQQLQQQVMGISGGDDSMRMSPPDTADAANNPMLAERKAIYGHHEQVKPGKVSKAAAVAKAAAASTKKSPPPNTTLPLMTGSPRRKDTDPHNSSNTSEMRPRSGASVLSKRLQAMRDFYTSTESSETSKEATTTSDMEEPPQHMRGKTPTPNSKGLFQPPSKPKSTMGCSGRHAQAQQQQTTKDTAVVKLTTGRHRKQIAAAAKEEGISIIPSILTKVHEQQQLGTELNTSFISSKGSVVAEPLGNRHSTPHGATNKRSTRRVNVRAPSAAVEPSVSRGLSKVTRDRMKSREVKAT